MGLAMTSGTPYFGSPYLKGQYASEVQGDEKALCHVSDLLRSSVHLVKDYRKETSTNTLTETLPNIMAQTKAG